MDADISEIAIATSVALLSVYVAMLPSVNFDGQSSFRRVEVENIRAYAVLPEELDAGYLSVSQYAPQFSLSVGRILSEAASIPFSAWVVIEVLIRNWAWLILS